MTKLDFQYWMNLPETIAVLGEVKKEIDFYSESLLAGKTDPDASIEDLGKDYLKITSYLEGLRFILNRCEERITDD